jgi:phenylalanyl-tRNA synthetase beta chain
MKISLNWLREYVAVSFTPQELDERLTMLGIEVEAIENFGEKFAKIVVGEVLEMEKHPNADKLKLTRVSLGSGQPLKIVCGAPNVRVGMKVAVAQVGANLGGGVVIKKSKIRGEASEGMLCSERELGLSENHDGLWDLPQTYVVGTPLAEAMGKGDVVLEIGITPNRPDCLSHIGIAREIAAITANDVAYPTLGTLNGVTPSEVSVSLQDADLCPRYMGRLVRNVQVKPSPQWLQHRLTTVGLRPINNIVDVTNYVLMECGHPLHAFDASSIANGNVVVRRARGFATEFVTLDGKKRTLDPETLLIADPLKALAIAGIMGGENSEIKDTTKNVFIESAYFLPSSIRRSSKLLGLSTDASYRFERGTDIEGLQYALDRATDLIAELGSGEIVGEVIDEYPSRFDLKCFVFRPAAAVSLLGMNIPESQMLDVFSRLNIGVDRQSNERWMLTSPTYRIDLEREVDASEELARVIGYEHIPTATFERAPLKIMHESLTHLQLEAQVRTELIALGLTECVSSPLVAERAASLFHGSPVEVINPLNEETNRLRTSVAANLLEIVRRNERFGAEGQRLFELGNVFSYDSKTRLVGYVSERMELGVLISGVQESKTPYNIAAVKADIFHLRGLTEQLLRRLNVKQLESASFKETEAVGTNIFVADYALTLSQNGVRLATIGKVKQSVADVFDLRGDTFLALIDYSALFASLYQSISIGEKVAPLPKYPAVERDIAIIVPENVSGGRILATIQQSVDKTLFEGARIFDEFRSQEMKRTHERSLAIRIVLRSKERTLDDELVDQSISSALSKLDTEFGARLRT